jgi:recombination protein RecR
VHEIPGPLADVVQRLSRLPGLGPRSALRIGLELLRRPREGTEALGTAILELRRKLCLCSRCRCIAEADPCALCADPARDPAMLCLVSDLDSLLAIEQGGFYNGLYMVLGGLLAPLDGVEPDTLEFEALQRRLGQGQVAELVLALGSTLEAEATASHVKNLVESGHPGVTVTRLAQGIPLGAEVRYVDKETLRQSLLHRQKL